MNVRVQLRTDDALVSEYRVVYDAKTEKFTVTPLYLDRDTPEDKRKGMELLAFSVLAFGEPPRGN